jgi:aminoglycoside 6'-N-acetyltransferase
MTDRLPGVTFRLMQEDEWPRLLAWFRAPHVAPWWRPSARADDLAQKYLPRLRGQTDMRVYTLLADDAPAGMIQAAPPDARHDAGAAACSIDFLIGEASLTGRGVGPRALDAFVTGEVFGRVGVSTCLADPDVMNRRSIRALEKAGFVQADRFSAGDRTFVLMARHKPANASLLPV